MLTPIPSLYERLAHILVGTPFQPIAEKIKTLFTIKRRLTQPELKPIINEPELLKQIACKFIKDGMNCIDVGCHLGSMLSVICKASPNGKHLAFEPIPYKALWLKKKFPHVTVQQLALSNDVGSVDFYFNPKKSGFSGLGEHNFRSAASAIKVNCNCLDKLIFENSKIDFIKIDIEGAEFLALQGAKQTIIRCKPLIIFECTKSGLATLNIRAEDIFNYFDSLNYKVYLPSDWLENKAPIDFKHFISAMNYPFKAFNFVAQI